jgi:antitoxin component YwqK of YwqJK toxin-antitoxin module
MSNYQLLNIFYKVNFLLIFLSCDTNSPSEYSLCKDLTEKDNVYLLDNNIYNGVCKIIDTDITINEKFIKEGKIYAEKGYYFPSGNIKYEGKIKNDSLSGKYFQYHNNGEFSVKGKFFKGYPDGKWKKYDNSGKLISTQFFKKGELIKTKF